MLLLWMLFVNIFDGPATCTVAGLNNYQETFYWYIAADMNIKMDILFFWVSILIIRDIFEIIIPFWMRKYMVH